MSKPKLIIAFVGFIVFGWIGDWVGIFTWLLILGIWGACSPHRPTHVEQTTPRNDGELVPAKRGKPDPTRPTEDDNAGWITGRKLYR